MANWNHHLWRTFGSIVADVRPSLYAAESQFGMPQGSAEPLANLVMAADAGDPTAQAQLAQYEQAPSWAPVVEHARGLLYAHPGYATFLSHAYHPYGLAAAPYAGIPSAPLPHGAELHLVRSAGAPAIDGVPQLASGLAYHPFWPRWNTGWVSQGNHWHGVVGWVQDGNHWNGVVGFGPHGAWEGTVGWRGGFGRGGFGRGGFGHGFGRGGWGHGGGWHHGYGQQGYQGPPPPMPPMPPPPDMPDMSAMAPPPPLPPDMDDVASGFRGGHFGAFHGGYGHGFGHGGWGYHQPGYGWGGYPPAPPPMDPSLYGDTPPLAYPDLEGLPPAGELAAGYRGGSTRRSAAWGRPFGFYGRPFGPYWRGGGPQEVLSQLEALDGLPGPDDGEPELGT